MIKKALLRKGWAGKTISRSDTVGRVNPVIRSHIVLNRSYDFAEQHLSDRNLAETLAGTQSRARMNVGKLAEVVFSNGGTAYSGTDIEPSDLDLGPDDVRILNALVELEEDLLRTRAILSAVESESRARLEILRLEARRHLR